TMEGLTMLCFLIRRAVVLAPFFLLPALCFSLPGCSYFQAEADDMDDEFGFDENEKSEKSQDEELDAAAKASEGELALRLKVGDRFPLKKRIRQQLTQQDGKGTALGMNVSFLELLLSLEVQEIRDGNKLLGVRYHRVHYGHNIAGRQVEYSSEQ